MSSNKVPTHQHRKKKYVYKERESPFPVPIASITRETPCKNYWYHYTGQIHGEFVFVTHSGDISYLNKMGFFGKGLMSRGEPSVYKDLPFVHLPSATNSEPDVLHVMRRRMYLKHMKWKKSHDLKLSNEKVETDASVSSEDQEFDSDIEWQSAGTHHYPADSVREDVNSDKLDPERGYTNKQSVINNSSEVRDSGISGEQGNDELWSSHLANQNTSSWSWNEEVSNQKQHLDSWDNASSTQKLAAESWDTMEADEDFWASEDVHCETHKFIELKETKTSSKETGSAKQKRETDDTSDFPVSQVKKVKLCHDNQTGKLDDSVCYETKGSDDTTFHDTKELDDSVCHSSEISNVNTDIECQVHNSHSVTNEIETKDVSKASKVPEEECIEMLDMQLSESQAGYSATTIVSYSDAVENNSELEGDSVNSLPIHPYCGSDAEDIDTSVKDADDKTAAAAEGESAEYLVIDDSDIDDSTEVVPRKEKYAWIPVRKKEVFNINEPLVLSFEEAFFLSYGLGCLTVKDENQSNLTLCDMWCRFCKKPQFLPRYVAYHYFRSKGWVPKPSILFGTDFLVYKVGPVFFHASYSVIVKTVYADTYEEVEDCNRKFTWTSFFGLNRITEHVAKTLVYCYVVMPRDLSEEEKKSPKCLSRFKIRLQTVQRWVSSQEREKDRVIEDIS